MNKYVVRSFEEDYALREKVVPATRNLRTNSVSTMYYKVVITTMNK